MVERKHTAVLKFKNGKQKIWGQTPIFTPTIYWIKEPKMPKMDVEEFTELTPENIINEGGFTSILTIHPEIVEFRFAYSLMNPDGSEVAYYDEN